MCSNAFGFGADLYHSLIYQPETPHSLRNSWMWLILKEREAFIHVIITEEDEILIGEMHRYSNENLILAY
jgi:hypothetical protein